MSVKKYSLKFVKISKYSSSLVSNSRDEMSRFVTGVSEDSEEECRVAMLHHKMDLCRLMVHAQQVEEIRWRKRGREGKKPRPSDQAGSSTGRSSFRVHDRPKFKKRYQHSGNPTPSRNTNANGDKSDSKKGNDINAQRDIAVWPRQILSLGLILDAAKPPKRNKFYALNGRDEQEKSANVLTDKLLVFTLPGYTLLDPGSTLSFVSTLVTSKFDFIPKISHEPFLVSTPRGDKIRAERVLPNNCS
ncbi:uncharacterized protein [Solanum lycopersicum]|uniref:uncharacterized protein n=1 Tax=Solanum lycopersicum TaxID=4081 RepID=UPI0037487B83